MSFRLKKPDQLELKKIEKLRLKALVWYLSWDSWEWIELESWDLSWVENLRLRVGRWGCEWVESEIVWVWEWVESEIVCVTEWLSVREGRRRAETESTGTSERELKMRRMNRVRLVRVLLFRPKRCVLQFFFFFLISACVGGFGQNRRESTRFQASRETKKKKLNASWTCRQRRRRVGRRCDGHFAASVKILAKIC